MSTSPSVRKIANRGTSSAVVGTISATNESARTARDTRGGSCEIAKPAHEATSTASGTAIAATSSEFAV